MYRLRVTGKDRTGTADSTSFALNLYASKAYVVECILEKCLDGMQVQMSSVAYANALSGGVVGGSDPASVANLRRGISALNGSQVSVYGTAPAAPTLTLESSGKVWGTPTAAGSPGTAPPPPVETVVTHEATGAYRITFPATTTGERWSQVDPQQGVYSSTRRYGIWILPAISTAKTIKSARLTIERATAYGADPATIVLRRHGQTSINPLTYYQRGTIDAWLTDTGHSVSMSRGDSTTIDLNAATIAALQSGACRGFAIGGFPDTPAFAQMKPSISLEITYNG